MPTESKTASLRVIITAAAGGLGSTMVRRFLLAGHKVVACDLDVAVLQDLQTSDNRLVLVNGDASSELDVTKTIDAALLSWSGIDVLINNVGIGGPTAEPEDITLDQWNETLRVNLTSHFLFARACIPNMKKAGKGLIVNISSGSAKTGLPLRLPYVVSKGAVISLTTNLARELGPHGIRVNAILPGPIRGPRITHVIAAKAKAMNVNPVDFEQAMLRYISLRTMVKPDDVSAMVEFLASEGGHRVSGQLIGVDGNIEWEE
jgi:NAD(P)-dependent dehydrogenase (short-subunit alcohol dehydrogenase family)